MRSGNAAAEARLRVGLASVVRELGDVGSASTLPPPDLGTPSSRRTEAPPVSPASNDQGRDGWLSDLLNRADASAAASPARETPRGRTAPQQQQPKRSASEC